MSDEAVRGPSLVRSGALVGLVVVVGMSALVAFPRSFGARMPLKCENCELATVTPVRATPVGGWFRVQAPSPGRWQVVATLTDSSDQACGTVCWPLAPGQALRFVFGQTYRQGWTMVGVRYPLWLYNVAAGAWVFMPAGVCCFMAGAGREFIEVRSA